MRFPHGSHAGRYMQTLVCINAAAIVTPWSAAAIKIAGHDHRTWSPQASVRQRLLSWASKRSSRNPSPTTSRTRKTQKAMDSVCDALGGVVQR
jgi:hypothetical protein